MIDRDCVDPSDGSPTWNDRLIQHEDFVVDMTPWKEHLNPRDKIVTSKNVNHEVSNMTYWVATGSGPVQMPIPADMRRNVDEKAVGMFVSANITPRFLAIGGGPGMGGSAGSNELSGSLRVSVWADGDGKVRVSPPDPIEVSAVSGGASGSMGRMTEITSPHILSCIGFVKEWGFDNKITEAVAVMKRYQDSRMVPSGQSSDASTITQEAEVVPVESPASIRNATQLLMVLQRVKFEYQIGFGAQVYNEDADSESDMAVALAGTTEYLGRCVGELQRMREGGGPVKSLAGAEQDAFLLNCTEYLHIRQTSADIFGSPLNLVSNPAVSLVDADDEIDALGALESVKASLEQELADRDTALQRASETAKTLEDAIGKSTAAKRSLVAQMANTYESFASLRDHVQAKQQLLAWHMDTFWDKVKGDFSYHGSTCGGWQSVLSTVGSVLMFAPEAGVNPAYGIGAGMEIGASISTAVDTMDQEHRDKAKQDMKQDAIEKRVYRISDALMARVDVQDFMKVVREDDPTIADPGAADRFQHTLLVERDKFKELCDRYFEDYIQSDDLQDEFDHLLNMVQDMKSGMQTYTRLALQYLQAVNDWKTNTAARSALLGSGTLSELAEPALDLVYNYYVRMVSSRFAASLDSLFQGVRAFNCMSMRRSNALAHLGNLESFDVITGAELKAALNELRGEIMTHLSQSVPHPHNQFTGTDVAFSLTPSSHPSSFANFKKSRSLTLNLLPRDKKVYGMEGRWYDIRLQGVRVHLEGAKPSPGRKSIVVHLSMGPIFYVQDDQMQAHDFQFPGPIVMSVAYGIGPAGNEFIDSSNAPPMYETDFQFQRAGGASTMHMPLATPFTAWNLSVSDAVDVSSVTRIDVELDIWARTARAELPRALLQPDIFLVGV